MTRTIYLLATLAGLVLPVSALAQPITSTKVIVAEGDPAPDGDGIFSALRPTTPLLNDAGQVAFYGAVRRDTVGGYDYNSGLFLGDGTSMTTIVRSGDSAPDGNGIITGFGYPALNDSGQVAFAGWLTDTTDGAIQGMYLADGTTLTEIARLGDHAPDGNGIFSRFHYPALNDKGQVAYWARVTGNIDGSNDNQGIFRGDGTTLTQIARTGTSAPDDNGSFSNFYMYPVLNDRGQVAFYGTLTETFAREGIFLGDGTTLTQIAREQGSTPDGNGFFTQATRSLPAVNNGGQVAFVGGVFYPTVGSYGGIFLADSTKLTLIAGSGEPAPDGNGTLSRLGDYSSGFPNVALNDRGQAAFLGALNGTTGGISDNFGIFRSDSTSLIQVVRKGDSTPDDNGIFRDFANPAVNDRGQVVFVGTLTGTVGGNSDDRGIFLYDDRFGLLTVAREGDDFLGSTITSLEFNYGGYLGDEWNGLNNRGQVAFQYQLANSKRGIALFSIQVPEPSSIALVSLAGLFGAAVYLRR